MRNGKGHAAKKDDKATGRDSENKEEETRQHVATKKQEKETRTRNGFTVNKNDNEIRRQSKKHAEEIRKLVARKHKYETIRNKEKLETRSGCKTDDEEMVSNSKKTEDE